MVFDVMIKEVEKNAAGKEVFNVFRVHDAVLSKYLREVQDKGKYIVSVIPLFRKTSVNNGANDYIVYDEYTRLKPEDVGSKELNEYIDRLDKSCIDPHGF